MWPSLANFGSSRLAASRGSSMAWQRCRPDALAAQHRRDEQSLIDFEPGLLALAQPLLRGDVLRPTAPGRDIFAPRRRPTRRSARNACAWPSARRRPRRHAGAGNSRATSGRPPGSSARSCGHCPAAARAAAGEPSSCDARLQNFANDAPSAAKSARHARARISTIARCRPARRRRCERVSVIAALLIAVLLAVDTIAPAVSGCDLT